MRLFIAINFTAATTARLRALRDELSAHSVRGSFSRDKNLHLTLVFLGECDRQQCRTVEAAMNRANFTPFDVTIEQLGRFRRRDGSIWWAGVKESAPLLKLQHDLCARLIAAGFDLDTHDYRPHITLGRRVVTKAVPRPLEPFGERVERIDLMRSEQIDKVLTYSSIYQTPAL